MRHVFFEGQVLWSQIDANQHLRHSAYADFGAQARLAMLEQSGMTTRALLAMHVGPILFREELQYLREVHMGDRISVACELTRSRPDGSRWTIRHELYRSDDTKAAIIIAEGAWIDTRKRKLTGLPEELNELFMKAPRSKDFIMEVPSSGQ